MDAYKYLEDTKCKSLNQIANDLLAGKKVSGVRYNKITGQMEQTYGTTDFRKRISELRLDYGMNIQFYWESNLGNNGKHKVHFMLPSDIEEFNKRKLG